MTTRINYVDEEKMKIHFSSMIFNVKSINLQFGSLAAFAQQYDLRGETNGRLFCLDQNPSSVTELYEDYKKIFRPLGLKKGLDYTYFFCHPLSDAKCEHPSCVGVPWLEGEILPEGNFVWFDDTPAFTNIITGKQRHKLSTNLSVPYFKVINNQDPDPGLPTELFKKVSFAKFISHKEEGFPVFIATQVGIFPEEVIMESLEGQRVAVFYSSVINAPVFIIEIINGNRTEIARFTINPSGGLPESLNI